MFYPDRPHEHIESDIGYDMDIAQSTRYDTELDCSGIKMTDTEYAQLMQSLNLKQSDLCTHIIQATDAQTDPMYIFIEGGAGVGKHKVKGPYINL